MPKPKETETLSYAAIAESFDPCYLNQPPLVPVEGAPAPVQVTEAELKAVHAANRENVDYNIFYQKGASTYGVGAAVANPFCVSSSHQGTTLADAPAPTPAPAPAAGAARAPRRRRDDDDWTPFSSSAPSSASASSSSPFICLSFARGQCPLGPQCRSYHRFPACMASTPETDKRDVFGRDRSRASGIGATAKKLSKVATAAAAAGAGAGREVTRVVSLEGARPALAVAALRKACELGRVTRVSGRVKSLLVEYATVGEAEFAAEALNGQVVKEGQMEDYLAAKLSPFKIWEWKATQKTEKDRAEIDAGEGKVLEEETFFWEMPKEDSPKSE